MSKYRIIKSIARDEGEPYFIQEWKPETANWEMAYTSGYGTLKLAQQRLKEWREYASRKLIPAEVVWEEKDEN